MRSTLLLPLGALGISLYAVFFPGLLAQLGGAIVPLLGLVMLGMGLTLRLEHFLEVLRRPRLILLGVGLQYLLMPLIAWAVSRALGLPAALLTGMVLVGACPGGTASNVICYLARGDVALSITLTTASTLLAVVFTPALTWLYLGQGISVPVGAMILDIARVVLAPVLGGMLLNHWLGRHLGPLKHAFPLISVAAIVLIIGIIVALNRPVLPAMALPLIVAVCAHNLLGLTGGYLLAGLFTADVRVRRTLAIEVGMQNSGLAVALAHLYFPAVAALPGALFSIWHNLSGSLLAGWWSRHTGAGPRTVSRR